MGLRGVPTRAALAERALLGVVGAGLAPGPVPVPLVEAYSGMLAARTIMAATQTGVLAALSAQPLDVQALAAQSGLDAQALDALLPALHTLGYVRPARRGRWRATRMVRRWLDPRSPEAMDVWVGSFCALMERDMASLEDVLRGAPAVGLHERDADDPYWEPYIAGLAQLARFQAPVIARALALDDAPRSVLDLAGGHGEYSMALCRRHPGLRATVVELEGSARVGRRLVAEAGMAADVDFLVGDLFEADLGAGHDVVMANDILHNLPRADGARLARLAHAALRPGGTFAVVELERPPDGRRGARVGTLTGVLFMVLGRTRTLTADELEATLRAAGFVQVRSRRPALLNGVVLVTGRRAP